jgi:lambda family phage portal protein
MNIWRRMMQAVGMPGGEPNAVGQWGRFAPMPGLESGAARRRMAPFVPTSEHINSLLRNAGDTTLARARWLVRNNGYAKAALRSWATATVGPGIKPSPRIDDAEIKKAVTQAFTDWTDEADAENVTDFYGIARRVSRECFLAGETFVRLVPRPATSGLAVPLQLRVLPSEQLPLWKNEQAPNGRAIRLGIEFDDQGNRAAYWFWRANPTDATLSFAMAVASNQLVRVPAEEVLHVYDPVEAGQLRGLSSYAPAIVKLFMMDVYDDAELERKKQAARFATFITRPATNLENIEQDIDQPGTVPDAGGNDTLDPYYGPGAFMMLGEGDDVKFSAPADVGGGYEPFQYRVLLQICSALGVPYGELSYDLSKATYASSRAGLLAFRGDVEAFQYAVLVYQFLRPVYLRWLQTAVVAGAVPIPVAAWNRDRARFARFQAITPRAPWVDPVKDVQAEALSVNNGFKSRSAVIEAQGYDAEEVDQQIAAERERAEELGLPEFPIKSAVSIQAQRATAPSPQTEQTTQGEEEAA